MYQQTGQAFADSYEKIYFSMWEMGQRYGSFTEFRVIGESHDQRMIPMLEVGKGEEVIFCISGIQGTENILPGILVKIMEEYCRTYECGWMIDDFYDVKNLLDKVRICMIPLLNPDGYEVCQKGWSGIRNPVYRQMLKMKQIPDKEYTGNGRGIEIIENFPTSQCTRQQVAREPGSENETKALIHLFQEYKSRGLLVFYQKIKKNIYYCHTQDYMHNKKSSNLVRHLRKYTERKGVFSYLGERKSITGGIGSPERFYAEKIKEPSLEIEISCCMEENNNFRDILLLPLEYNFSLEK